MNVAISFFFGLLYGVGFDSSIELGESSLGSRWSLGMPILTGSAVAISRIFALRRFEGGCGPRRKRGESPGLAVTASE